MILAQGEFHRPGESEDPAVARSRFLFREAIKQLVPEVLQALWADVRPAYDWNALRVHLGRPVVALRGEYIIHETEMRHWVDVKQADDAFYPEFVPLKHALLHWADQFSLTEDWMIEHALVTVRFWEGNPSARESLEWATTIFHQESAVPPEEQRIVYIEEIGWQPHFETRAQGEKRLLDAYRKRVGEHMSRIEAHYKRAGWRRTPVKRKPEHFEWLVRYQVQRWSMSQIADEYVSKVLLTEDAIAKGLHQTARLVGLRLRKAHKGGRPTR